MSRGKKNRRLPDLSFTIEEWERRAANLAVGTIGVTGADPAADRDLSRGNGQGHRRPTTRRPGEAGRITSPPPVRDLTDEQLQRLRSEWVTTITRPHRKPWHPKVLDLSDLPCICTADAACALHLHELGGPRPFARS
jgi:hypothetical protein